MKLKHPCQHLEKLITPIRQDPLFESVNRNVSSKVDSSYYESGAGFVIPEYIKTGAYERQFRTKLRKYGLQPVYEDVVVHRFIYGESLQDIALELSITTPMTVHRLLKEALVYLKKRGFK